MVAYVGLGQFVKERGDLVFHLVRNLLVLYEFFLIRLVICYVVGGLNG